MLSARLGGGKNSMWELPATATDGYLKTKVSTGDAAPVIAAMLSP